MFFDACIIDFESHRCDSLSVSPGLQQSSTPGVHCSRTLHQGGWPDNKKKGSERKRIRLMFKAACEHEEALDPGFCEERAHSRHLGATAPPGISDRAVRTLHAVIHVLYRGATSGGLKADCALMHTSVNVQYGTMSMTFLRITSASLSYCKPAAVPGPGALSDSPQ